MAKVLTQAALESLKPGKKRCEIPDGGKNGGLYFIMQTSGAASWAYRYRFDGRARKLTLGPFPALTLAAARDAAVKARASIADGKDPGEEKQEKRRAAQAAAKQAALAKAKAAEEAAPPDLVKAVAGSFVKRYAKVKMRRRSWMEAQRIFEHDVVPKWGKRRLSTIGRADINDLVDAVMDRGTPIMANRVLGTLKTMGRWAVERGIVDRNPFSDIRQPAPTSERDRVLDDRELAALIAAADAEPYPGGPMVRTLLMTAARRAEVAELVWSELDLDAKVWTLPASRAKNKREHKVPLPDGLVDMLRGLPRFAASDFVFSSTGKHGLTKFHPLKRRLDRAMAAQLGVDAVKPWVLHDLRRTAATNFQKLGTRFEVAEAILNHVGGSRAGVAGIYLRHDWADEKRAALDAWARRLREIASDEAAPTNVIPLTKAL
jgi:integrase